MTRRLTGVADQLVYLKNGGCSPKIYWTGECWRAYANKDDGSNYHEDVNPYRAVALVIRSWENSREDISG